MLFCLIILRPPRSTRTDTLFPYRRSSDRTEVTGFSQTADGVVATVGGQPCQADYIAGCDGAHSMVREQVRSEEHTSELQSLMRNSSDVFCLKNKRQLTNTQQNAKNRHE